MKQPIKILLQTTIPPTADDWSIARFSLLADYLASLKDEADHPLYQVTARDYQRDQQGNDPVLSTLAQSDYDELWLFAVDIGDAVSQADCDGITAFRQRGGGVLTTRDHHDLGSSLCNLCVIGEAHYFHSKNIDPDEARRVIDDTETTTISWPNYHSGRNGDYQVITPLEPVHELIQNPASPDGMIKFLPAHPHEGAGVPPNQQNARVIAIGNSRISNRPFNLVVVFDREKDEVENLLGRAIAESTFHHFCDYNWDADMGCPSFVTEPAGDTIKTEPRAMADVKAYMQNLAAWLAPVT